MCVKEGIAGKGDGTNFIRYDEVVVTKVYEAKITCNIACDGVVAQNHFAHM